MYDIHVKTDRYSDNGVVGIITDVEMLRNCNFFVGTFSSNVCLCDFINVLFLAIKNKLNSSLKFTFFVYKLDLKKFLLTQHN